MRFFRLIAVVLAMSIAAAGCSSDDETQPTVTSTSISPGRISADDGEDRDIRISLSVYFLDEDGFIRVGNAREFIQGAPGDDVLEALMQGTSESDEALGLHSAIPEGTTVRALDIAGDMAAVDLSVEFAGPGDERSGMERLAQVVYTVTQFPVINQVEILVNGEAITELGETGVTIPGLLSREDFEFMGIYGGIAPSILVEMPRPGQLVSADAAHIEGTSSTFESALYVEVLDESGEVIAPEFYFMAGEMNENMRSTFSEIIEIGASGPGIVIIRAYDISAESGERVGITDTPVQVVG